MVVELQCSADELRAPETEPVKAPYALSPRFEFGRERLYFLARANNYDDRGGRMAWGPGLEAQRLGAVVSDLADVLLDGGRPAWCDGGPRAGATAVPGGHVLVHRNSLEQRLLDPDRAVTTNAELAADQLAAVVHDTGAARVIAPAGSGKTRVLTERFRLLVDRGWSPGSITAVAYNVRAKDTMRARLADMPEGARRRVRTLHALGNDVLRRAGGNALIDEWEMRRRIEALVPVKPRANTDMYAPYLEALGEVRLGLVDPNVIEAQRDDVAGFGAMFDEYRDKLHADRAIDHDEQIYGAIEALLRAPDVRREFQRESRHLLVDEFQDLTPAQLLLLRLVAAPAYDVFGSATTIRSSTATRAPIRSSSSTTTATSPAERTTRSPRTTAARRRSSPRPATSSRTTGGASTSRSWRPRKMTAARPTRSRSSRLPRNASRAPRSTRSPRGSKAARRPPTSQCSAA